MSLRRQKIMATFVVIIAIIISALALLNLRDVKSQNAAMSEVMGMMISDEPDVRAGALSNATRYFLDDRLSGSLYSQIIFNSRGAADDEIRRVLSQSIWQVSQEKGHESLFKEEMLKGRMFVDIRYQEGISVDALKKFVDTLKGETFDRGPLLVNTKPMQRVEKAEIRCFADDCDNDKLTRDISDFLKENHIEAMPINKLKILRQPLMYINTIEIWLRPEDLKTGGTFKVRNSDRENRFSSERKRGT